ncbi:MAG: hypothetical protein ACK5AZ_14720 [Bryobacteraceae bacterium]
MIIYRPQSRVEALRPFLAELCDRAAAVADLDAAASLLIDCGDLESALTDTICPREDDDSPLARLLGAATLLAARAFVLMARGTPRRSPRDLRSLQLTLDRLQRHDLPADVRIPVPEGYAYYALYPETYAESARCLAREHRPERVFVLGIRSIGSSLGAVVAAALELEGCRVSSITVRPRGHPFDRRLAVTPFLAGRLRAAAADHWFAVVDEGPGLSGSSFASVSSLLARLGVPDRRIVLFPSWIPDGSRFVSASARTRWQRHAKYWTPFERVCAPHPDLLDISGGRWRPLFVREGDQQPPVQPQHERRKYYGRRGGLQLWKFAGLGRYGLPSRTVAERLADAGFAPPVLGLHRGFLSMAFVYGHPLTSAQITEDLLAIMARYVAFRRRALVANCSIPFDENFEMIRVNLNEGLGGAPAHAMALLERCRGLLTAEPAVAIDGRMLPHEWIATVDRYRKTDGADHHRDDFFPGCQDAAWDLAGACAEFGLSPGARAYLLGQYRRASGDDAAPRLPYYLIAYLAFRLGYVTVAAASAPESAEAARFQLQQVRYRSLLERELIQICEVTRP